jgi:Polyketide synthase dehydratase
MIGLMARNLPDNHQPANLSTQMSPRMIELCFQTAGLWEIATQGRMGLPFHVDQVSTHGDVPANARLYAVVTPDQTHEAFDAQVVDEAGTQYVHLRGYRTVATPNVVSADQRKALLAIMSPEPVAA